MKRSLQRAAVGFSGVALLGGLMVASPQPVLAEEPCVTELSLEMPSPEEAQAETPVLAIHGLWGDEESWTKGDTPMSSVIEGVANVKVAYFDYESTNDRWVANSDAAHRLAKTIVCYSLLYDGKDVVLVTHSMGGLLAREALDWAADGTFVKDVVGHVITIAPPHEGSALANADASFWMAKCLDEFAGLLTFFIADACSQIESSRATSGLSVDSEQLAELPKFPEGITVKTIAGDATWRICLPWGCSSGVDQNGDLVVSVDSATAEYTKTGVGDGKTVFECDTSIPVPMITNAWCEHSNMLQDERVQYEVRASIEAFIASQTIEKTDFYGLQLPVDEKDWMIVYPEHGTNWAYTNDVHAIIVDNACVTDDDMDSYARMFCPGFSIINMNESGYEDWMPYDPEYDCHTDWLHDNYSLSGPHDPEQVTIGGVEAIHQEHWLCEYDDHWNPVPPDEKPNWISHSWLIPEKGLLIFDFYNDGPEPLPGLPELLAGASW